MQRRYVKRPIPVTAEQATEVTQIHTIEGVMTAQPGDYIVTGVEGEKWPVKKSIFEKTYEELPSLDRRQGLLYDHIHKPSR